MIFIETPIFTKIINNLMDDNSYAELQSMLIINPESGTLIGSHGLRKVRWKYKGKGKRGGVRIIYYWMTKEEKIYFLLAYTKNEQDTVTTEQLKVLCKIIEKETKYERRTI